jgi:methylmalonyl-CoA carboxyltransferase large subunit
MKSDTVDLTKVVEALEVLRGEISRLGQRIAALEAVNTTQRPALDEVKEPLETKVPAPPPASAPKGTVEGLDEELVLVISAAIAAFLGKRPHIRQIRLIGTGAWAQQGRVMIQASHALSVHSVRSQL